MNHKKGFSLLEVLISLMLLTLMGVALFEQRIKTAQLLHSLEQRIDTLRIETAKREYSQP